MYTVVTATSFFSWLDGGGALAHGRNITGFCFCWKKLPVPPPPWLRMVESRAEMVLQRVEKWLFFSMSCYRSTPALNTSTLGQAVSGLLACCIGGWHAAAARALDPGGERVAG
jgi:hypothetical protein